MPESLDTSSAVAAATSASTSTSTPSPTPTSTAPTPSMGSSGKAPDVDAALEDGSVADKLQSAIKQNEAAEKDSLEKRSDRTQRDKMSGNETYQMAMAMKEGFAEARQKAAEKRKSGDFPDKIELPGRDIPGLGKLARGLEDRYAKQAKQWKNELNGGSEPASDAVDTATSTATSTTPDPDATTPANLTGNDLDEDVLESFDGSELTGLFDDEEGIEMDDLTGLDVDDGEDWSNLKGLFDEDVDMSSDQADGMLSASLDSDSVNVDTVVNGARLASGDVTAAAPLAADAIDAVSDEDDQEAKTASSALRMGGSMGGGGGG